MTIFLSYLWLAALFVVLGVCADLAVKNIKYIALALRMRIFSLGILLGIITSFPELSVGINATVEGAAALSVGNLIGGVIVVIGLILGASLLFGRQIKTDKSWKSLLPESLLILSPIFLGLDGRFGFVDGAVMIALYFGLLFYLYRLNHLSAGAEVVFLERGKIARAFFLALIAVAGIMLSAHWIVEITVSLLAGFAVSKLLVGILVFSLGTNLPEIIITFASWRRKSMELSLSHLMSSAFANILILGSLAVLKPISFEITPAYYASGIFLALSILAFARFAYSDRRLDRREGAVLLAIYFLFLATNIYLIVR